LVDVVACPTRTRAECARNRRILSLPGAEVPVAGFGSSDCRCAAHLVYFSDHPSLPSRTAGARS